MLASLLERLDVFLVWQMVLLVAGTTALTRLSRKKAIAVVFGIWLAFALMAMIPDVFPRIFSRFRYF